MATKAAPRVGLPARVYLKHGAYYYVDLARKWHRLCREKDGLPAMYRALASLTESARTEHLMPAVISRWCEDKIARGDWSDGTQVDMERVSRIVGNRFAEFSPSQVTAPIAAQYLKAYIKQPRTYNLHRNVLRQVMSFAALEGLRTGYNPIDDVPAAKQQARHRIVTDAEIVAIKAALMGAKRGGRTHCLMLDLCLELGQRIGDVLNLRWQDITESGIVVDQSKTGARRIVAWSPALHSIIEELGQGRDRIGHLLVQSTGKAYTYAGIRSAWVRALEKAGVEDLHIHDLRGRAGADVADSRGIYEAQKLLGHASVQMTEHYVKTKTRTLVKGRSGV